MSNRKIIPTVQITSMRDSQASMPQNRNNGQIQPPLECLATLEQIRREYHQWKYRAEPRLQRVYSITQS